MEPVRTFVAIEIPGALKARITQLQARWARESYKISWTKAQNIHLTLKFLGPVPAENLEPIGQELGCCCAAFSPFAFFVGTPGVFPSVSQPRVLWVGANARGDELLQLSKKIDDALIKFGFSKESRKFVPHLTVGRVKASLPRNFIDSFLAAPFETRLVKVREIVLMRSDLRPAGAVYTPVRHIALSKFQQEGLHE